MIRIAFDLDNVIPVCSDTVVKMLLMFPDTCLVVDTADQETPLDVLLTGYRQYLRNYLPSVMAEGIKIHVFRARTLTEANMKRADFCKDNIDLVITGKTITGAMFRTLTPTTTLMEVVP